jgi:protein ImuA
MRKRDIMTMPHPGRASLLASLRGAIARHDAPREHGTVPVSGGPEAGGPEAGGPEAGGIDTALPGGGLARGAIHEILVVDSGCSTAFCGYLLSRAGGLACWIMPPRATDIPWPAGLLAQGLDPACLILVEAAGQDALWAAEQALRSPALAAVAAVLPPLDLAAARRLQLAAEAGGTLGLILRPDTAHPGEAPAQRSPTVARTRWRITALPGQGGSAHRLGAARWRVALLHARGARPGSWDITFDPLSKSLIIEKTFMRQHG